MFRQTLIQERVVGAEQVEHVAIFAQDALEEQLRFAAQGLPQVVVEIGKQPRVRRDRREIAEVEPLLREVVDQRLGAADRPACGGPAVRARRARAACPGSAASSSSSSGMLLQIKNERRDAKIEIRRCDTPYRERRRRDPVRCGRGNAGW